METPMNAIRIDELRCRTAEMAARAELAVARRGRLSGRARRVDVAVPIGWLGIPFRATRLRATA